MHVYPKEFLWNRGNALPNGWYIKSALDGLRSAGFYFMVGDQHFFWWVGDFEQNNKMIGGLCICVEVVKFEADSKIESLRRYKRNCDIGISALSNLENVLTKRNLHTLKEIDSQYYDYAGDLALKRDNSSSPRIAMKVSRMNIFQKSKDKNLVHTLFDVIVNSGDLDILTKNLVVSNTDIKLMVEKNQS